MIPTWIEVSASNREFLSEITRVFKNRHMGRNNAVKLPALALEILGITPADKTYANATRTLRRSFEIINQDFEGLIVSDTEVGYWYAASLIDGLAAVDALKSRALTILKNANTVEANIANAYGGQLGLFL